LQVSISIGLADSWSGNTVEELRENTLACLEQAKSEGGRGVIDSGLSGPDQLTAGASRC
jgi:hypothetical protein